MPLPRPEAPRAHIWRCSAWLSAVAVGGFGALPGNAARPHSIALAQKCSAYVVADSRGSGEPLATLSRPGAAFVREFRKLHSSVYVGAAMNSYDAVGSWNIVAAVLKLPIGYHQSVGQGKAWLRSELSTLASTCPETKVVLTGYSQGAQVAADVAQEAPNRQIVGVVLFGDPYFNHGDARADRGDFARGLDGTLGTRPIFTGSLGGRVLTYCHRHDPVCQGPLSYYELARYRFTRHNNYDKQGEPEEAARYITKTERPTATGSAREPVRRANTTEFRAIYAAVEKGPDGNFYCATPRSTFVSGTDSRWAAAVMRSNCQNGLAFGSQTVRFFLNRSRRASQGWRLMERQYERLGSGQGTPCGSARVPADIRCAPYEG